MTRKVLQAATLALAFPAAALAFEPVDTIPWPSLGRFPAYPAEPEHPRNIWLQGGVLWDDNVLRTAAGARSEQVMRLGGGVRHDVRLVGRQNIRLEASADAYAFRETGEFDHIAYGVLGEWRWELGNDLAGTLGYTRRKYQADPSEIQAARSDEITANRLYWTGAYRLGSNVRLRGAADYTHTNRPAFSFAETRTFGGAAGIDYVTPLGNAIGLEVRGASGDAPVPEPLVAAPGTFADNDFEMREVAVVATYVPGPMLRFGGRVGYTEWTYSQISGRDFSGGTFRGAATWLPGNKTSLTFEAYREPRTVWDVGAGHVLITGLSFGPSWAPTAKLVFSARILRENRDFQGDPNTPFGGVQREDVVNRFTLSAGWEITRHLKLGAAIDHGKRDSNIRAPIDRNYDYTATMVNLRYDF